MEDVLDATFYHDDFLTRTLTSSVLYDKSQLDLNFADNNNSLPLKRELNDVVIGCNNADSPNLDFLKLGSPDLEQMFMTINENDSNISDESEAFALDTELGSADNCFADALQQLHDKQDAMLVDPVQISQKVEKENLRTKLLATVTKRKPSLPRLLPPPQQKFRSQNPMKQLYHNMNNNQMRRNTFTPQPPAPHQQVRPNNNNKMMHRNINNLHHDGLHPQHMSLNEQIALSNQMAIISNMTEAQQMQQQQEIAFLTQAMGYPQPNNEPQRIGGADSMMSTGFPPQSQTSHGNLPNHVQQQMPHHVQHKLLEQQMLQQQQQMNGMLSNNNNDNTFQQVQQMDSLNALGIDESTLKMLMENPHMVPVNLELQELIKRERKKLRNRVASSKCRKRKLEREGRLEDRVKDLKEKNIELNAVANALKQQICDLKQRVMDHVGEGCQIVLPS